MKAGNLFKRKIPTLSQNDKAIIDTLIKSLGIGASDNILEVSKSALLIDSGVFVKYGCHADSCDDITQLQGGIYEYIFLFNLPYREIIDAKDFIACHTDCGKAVIINTTKKLTARDADSVAGYYGGRIIHNCDFTLIVYDCGASD